MTACTILAALALAVILILAIRPRPFDPQMSNKWCESRRSGGKGENDVTRLEDEP